MNANTTDLTDIRKHLNWKVALASGIIIGAGFGAVSMVQADQRAVETPEAIEIRAEQRYPGGFESDSVSGGGLSVDAADTSVESVQSATSVPAPQPMTSQSVSSPDSPATPVKVAPAPAPVQLDSVDSPDSPAQMISVDSVDSPASLESVDSPDSIDS